jgi:Flp pilus assembly protein CpaB
MKPKTLILMLVAVGCGLVAAYLASQVGSVGSTDNRVGVVVALVDLPAGSMIKEPEKMTQVKAFLADSAPVEGQRLTNIEDVRNKTIGRNILKGEPILARDFSEQGSLFRPAPPGYRAVTIRVTMDSSVAGFALPGSKVDLVCTRTNPSNQNQTMTETFMENVLVLAVNTIRTSDAANADAKGGVVTAPSVVTLAAKPVDAARIIWAKEKGQIAMVLRRPGDEDEGKVPAIVGLDAPGAGGEGPGGRGKSQMEKVWVARENVFPGQLDKPETIFALEDVPPTMAREAFKGPNPPPAGRLYSLVAKGMPVTPLHFKLTAGSEVAPGGVALKEKPFIMVVREGGKEPRYFKFTADGQLIPDDGGAPAAAPGGAAQGGNEGAGEIK